MIYITFAYYGRMYGLFFLCTKCLGPHIDLVLFSKITEDKNHYKLENVGDTDQVIFVYLSLVPMHICVKCEGRLYD